MTVKALDICNYTKLATPLFHFKPYLLMNIIIRVVVILLTFTNPINIFCQSTTRIIIPLNKDWKFSFINNVSKQQVNSTVSIPHTWNAGEVKNSKVNYQRTAAVYRKRV